MTSPTGSDQNHPQGGAPQGQPGWNAPQQPGYTPPAAYGQQQGYDPATSYTGAPAPTGQRPTQVTAAAIVAIVWGGLGAIFGLLVTIGAFALGETLAGLVFLLSTALSVGLIVAGVQVLQGKSPRLLLLLSYVAIGLSLLSLVVSVATVGGNPFSAILGVVVPGVIVFLLMQPQTRQHYAARGIGY